MATPACTSDVKTQPKSSTSMSNSSSHSQQTSQLKSSSTTSRSTSLAPKQSNATPKPKDLTSILGSDGKLLPEEKACCKQLGLCSYCGGNHEQCNLKPSGSSSNTNNSSNTSSNTSTPSKTTSNTASSSKPKGCITQIVDSAADTSDTGDSAAMDF